MLAHFRDGLCCHPRLELKGLGAYEVIRMRPVTVRYIVDATEQARRLITPTQSPSAEVIALYHESLKPLNRHRYEKERPHRIALLFGHEAA